MLAWVALRAAIALFLIWGATTLTFLLIHAAPGDPSDLYLTEELAPDQRAALRTSLGLDRPLAAQYLCWLSGVARGDLGISFSHHRPVAELLAERLPATLALALPALMLHLGLGAALGVAAAARRGSAVDAGLTSGAVLLYSIPLFWLGGLLILLFSIRLGWLPAGGLRDPFAGPLAEGAAALDHLRHLLLPVLCLALGSAAWTARLVRSSMLTALASPYVRAARARGASRGLTLGTHAFRNALRPLIVTAGLSLPALASGSVIVENLFDWPGMGLLSVEAVFARDYPVVLAGQLLVTLLVVAGTLFADLGLAAADPRVAGEPAR